MVTNEMLALVRENRRMSGVENAEFLEVQSKVSYYMRKLKV